MSGASYRALALALLASLKDSNSRRQMGSNVQAIVSPVHNTNKRQSWVSRDEMLMDRNYAVTIAVAEPVHLVAAAVATTAQAEPWEEPGHMGQDGAKFPRAKHMWHRPEFYKRFTRT
jgi:hypothetical protein